MRALFDGNDEAFQARERDYLRTESGMNYGAIPLAWYVDGEWQTWWRDDKQKTWFYRVSGRKVVQIPF